MAALPEPQPLIGSSGRMLNAGLSHAGIDRAQCRVMNLVPVRAPGDAFADHLPEDVAWARERFRRELGALTDVRVIVALGANPTEWMLGGKPPVAQWGESSQKKEGFISEWRGSALPLDEFRLGFGPSVPVSVPERYLQRLPFNPPSTLRAGVVLIPTFHPAAVLRQFDWHPWFLLDLQKAARIARDGLPPLPKRKWFFNDLSALERLARSGVDLIAVDTEMQPAIVGLATEGEVHVFEWHEAYRAPLERLLTSDRVLKVAHNWAHDFASLRLAQRIHVERPIFDTQGAAHIAHVGLKKSLSPHIATRYTPWPYHKWLANVDPLLYNGMDCVVTFDAYWPQITELRDKGLMEVAVHDHRLLMPLMEMQATGFMIDEHARLEVEHELAAKLDASNAELERMAEPVISTSLTRFEKPHLFEEERKCDCCGGGKTQREHCWRDGGLTRLPTSKSDYLPLTPLLAPGQKPTLPNLRMALPPCVKCQASGKVKIRLAFNSDSPDQLADLLYRGLKIRPRKFKGKETVKAAQLEPLAVDYPLVALVVTNSGIRAEYDTVTRLTAGIDGALHCVFDPFGTGSGRVASKESLLEAGTNAMNLPKEARRFVVPRAGKIFLYPDMAQIEARAVAVLADDHAFKRAFLEPVDWPTNPKHGKIDSHTMVQKMMLDAGVRITRDQTKRLVYAGMYGGGAKQLAVELNAEAFRKGFSERVTEADVTLMLTVFFKVMHRTKQWQLDIQSEVLSTRKLRCKITGREREWLGYVVDKKTKGLKHDVAKEVMSFLPQHMAAWVLGEGLIELHRSDDWGTLLTPLIHVHDALLIEADELRVDEASAAALRYLSRDFAGMHFPAEMKVGKNWLEAS